MFVTDTHSWLWYLSNDSRLSSRASQIFDSADKGREKIMIPSIVVIESIYIAKKKDYDLEMKEIIENLKVSSNYFVEPMDYRIISEFVRDDRKLSIHDKIITITAEKENAGLISKDQEVQDKAKVEVEW